MIRVLCSYFFPFLFFLASTPFAFANMQEQEFDGFAFWGSTSETFSLNHGHSHWPVPWLEFCPVQSQSSSCIWLPPRMCSSPVSDNSSAGTITWNWLNVSFVGTMVSMSVDENFFIPIGLVFGLALRRRIVSPMAAKVWNFFVTTKQLCKFFRKNLLLYSKIPMFIALCRFGKEVITLWTKAKYTAYGLILGMRFTPILPFYRA